VYPFATSILRGTVSLLRVRRHFYIMGAFVVRKVFVFRVGISIAFTTVFSSTIMIGTISLRGHVGISFSSKKLSTNFVFNGTNDYRFFLHYLYWCLIMDCTIVGHSM